MIILVAVGCSLGRFVHRARVQRGAVNAVMGQRGRGNTVAYDWEYKNGKYIPRGKPRWPRGLVELVGVDYFGTVVRVFLPQHGSDADLSQIGGLYWLEELVFMHSSPTADGLAHLEGLTQLEYLDLSKSGVTDTGMAHLKGLTGVRSLIIKDCPVSEIGLANIRGLAHLELLRLNGTKITEAGLAHLDGLAGIQQLYLTNTEIKRQGNFNAYATGSLETLDLKHL
jgi:hypothetical protein